MEDSKVDRVIPVRDGARPRTTTTTPHSQLDEFSPEKIYEQLWERMVTLPHVSPGPSLISEPGARALHLAREQASGPPEAFIERTEFAHMHGDGSGSLHLTLPLERAEEIVGLGWGETHPIAKRGLRPCTLIMVFGPRDGDELEIVWRILRESSAFALGEKD